MGNFYVNHTVRTDDAAAVASVLESDHRHALVTPSADGQVVIYDKVSDSQNPAEWRAVARSVSQTLNAPCLVVANHDDDILMYELFESGQLTEEFNSNPGYFGQSGSSSQGRGTRLCAAWGVLEARFAVAALLRSHHAFAVELHVELAKAIGLPDHAVGLGFNYVDEGDLPPTIDESDLLRVPES